MTKTILYYSTTGHALTLARKFTPASLIDVCRNEEIPEITDVLGLVFPSVNSALPFPMKKAIENLASRDNSKLGYIFVIALLYDKNSFNGRIVEKEFEESGLNLSYFNTVRLTDGEKIKEIIKDTDEEKILLPRVSFTYRLQKKITERLNKPSLPTGLEVTGNCDGCGSCIKLCPMNNIVIDNGKAKLLDECIHCLTCFSFCPKNAINSNYKKKVLMEGVKLEELFKRGQ